MTYKVTSSKHIHSAKYFSVVEEGVVLPNGHSSTRTVVYHPGAIIVIPMLDDQHIVFVKQYRHAIRDTIIELPAGTIENKEEPLACAKRELIEETGYSAVDWHNLGEIYPAPGFCSELQYVYLAKNLSTAFLEKDDDEIIEVVVLSKNDALQMIKSGEIKDAKTIASLCRAQICGMI